MIESMIQAEADDYKVKVIRYYLHVALLYLVIFLPLLIIGNYSPVVIGVHIFDVAVVAWGYWSMRRQNINAVSQGLCFIAFITVAAVTISGGVAKTGLFLAFPYVPFVVFLRPKGSALRWIGGMTIVLVISLFLALSGIINMPYAKGYFSLYVIHFLISVLLVLAYVNEKVRADQRVKVVGENNLKIADQLRKEAEDKSKLAEEYRIQADELKELNAMMIGRELKMAELKRELKASRKDVAA